MRFTQGSILSFVLVVLVVTAGCSGGGGAAQDGQTGGDFAASGGGGGDAERATAVAEATATPAAGDGAKARAAEEVDGEFQAHSRARIKTGHVELEVEDFSRARRNLTRAAEGYGGFVSDARQRLHRVDNETYTTGVVVLRVPAENFTALMDRIGREGTVLRTEENSRDVTDQLVDINARLKNLRAQRDQLRELYRRANDTEDVLQVQDRLSDVQGEIERLEARKKSLTRKVALSTITVEIREPRPEPEPPERQRWYEAGFVDAFLDSVNGVIIVVRAGFVAIAYALPYVLAFGAPLVIAAAVFRWRRRRSGPEEPDLHDAEEIVEEDEEPADENSDEE